MATIGMITSAYLSLIVYSAILVPLLVVNGGPNATKRKTILR